MNSVVNRCDCKSSCSVKRKNNRGCPCKGRDAMCSAECKCGTRAKPWQNKGTADKPERQQTEGSASRRQRQGFRLTHAPVESEEIPRGKEHENVKKFIDTLDANLVRKLAIRSLRRGIGNMDYIDMALIMEDDLDEDDKMLGGFGEPSNEIHQAKL